MWQRKQLDAVRAEHSNNRSDFLSSDEERGLIQKTSWWLPVMGIALIVLLLLFVSIVK